MANDPSSHGFDAGEIFPGVGHGEARLPRRQAGSSPQDLTVMLFADYALRHRVWFPTAALVALLGEFGVTPGAARTTVNRLAHRGVVHRAKDGRRTSYRLTPPASTVLIAGGRRIAGFVGQAEAWDNTWTLVAFTLPKERDADRRTLRNRLRLLGYAPLFDGLWVSPQFMDKVTAETLSGAVSATVTVFRARRVDLGAADRDPLEAWDLSGIAEEYADFIGHWTPLLGRLRAGDLNGADALRARTGVMDDYRRFPLLDPEVPLRLMPPGWPREEARNLFVALYDGLADPALEHVLRLVAASGDAPVTGIGAYSVADLLTGIPS